MADPTTRYASRLAAPLRQEVAGVQPDDRLPAILDRANRRPAACYIALALTVALLLAAALIAHARQGEPPAQTTVHMQEA